MRCARAICKSMVRWHFRALDNIFTSATVRHRSSPVDVIARSASCRLLLDEEFFPADTSHAIFRCQGAKRVTFRSVFNNNSTFGRCESILQPPQLYLVNLGFFSSATMRRFYRFTRM
jgi:hypothetical protein